MKMKQIPYKKIVGLFILVIMCAFMFAVTDVNAEGQLVGKVGGKKPKCTQTGMTDEDWVKRYGVDLKYDENTNRYSLVMKPKSNDASTLKKLRKAVFNVITINGQPVSGLQVSYNNPLELTGKQVKNANNDDVIEILIKSIDSNQDPDCTGDISFGFGAEVGEENDASIEEDYGELNDGLDSFSKQAINCNKSWPQDSFEFKFCDAKNKATAPGSKTNFSNKFNNFKKYKDVYGNAYSTFKCSKTKIDTSAGYYVNTQYLYGSGEQVIDKDSDGVEFGHYTYNYAPGMSETSAKVQCKVRCEESVVVEYGPPVASKAGLCFEYKIRVTSRVSCNMTEKPIKPKHKTTYKPPRPMCFHAGVQIDQGGPNEDYEACIEECDGGKYTDKCSNKCYKKVYGNSSKKTSAVDTSEVEKVASKKSKSKTTKKSKNSTDTTASELARCESINPIGCYYVKNGNVYWSNVNHQGHWYDVNKHKDYSNYILTTLTPGIWRRKYSDGSFCHDTCYWSTSLVGKGIYLNPGVGKSDYEKNKAIYDKAVAACKAAASCSTLTATFTIAADYIDGNGNTKTVDFPYNTNPKQDRISSLAVKAPVNTAESNKTKTTITKENSTGLFNYYGCYRDVNVKNAYQVEWSFPGTWLNAKYGDISFEPVNKAGWEERKYKFCIPLDAKDVNQEWWMYYYTHYLGKTPKTSMNSGDAGVEKSCEVKSKDPKDINITWNIRGKTTDFGYFGWRIETDCFYALNKNYSKSGADKNLCGTSEYRIRSVDLNNLFPDSAGGELTDASKAGRTPGFNWSTYAENNKNQSFKSSPKTYMNEVQSLGYAIYNDEDKDYEFSLSRQDLAKLKGHEYTKFEGKMIENRGIKSYVSNVFRNGAISAKRLPDTNLLGCNNLKNEARACAD